MCLCHLAQGSSADRPEKPRRDSAADPQTAGPSHGANHGKSCPPITLSYVSEQLYTLVFNVFFPADAKVIVTTECMAPSKKV